VRIAIATRYRQRVGGVESYLETLLPALDRRGHALLLLSEDAGTTRPIALPDRATYETLSAGGLERAVGALVAWRPDVLFLQGMSEARYEEALVPIAPTALFLHAYHGTCISGTKTHAFPGTSPCVRVLGPGCLAQYFPRRCGGLSPVTMWQLYAAETAHKAMFERYRQVVVLSEHMKREAVRHGVSADAVTVLAPPIDGPSDAVLPNAKRARLASREPEPLRLLFMGRHEVEKGGQILIDALPAVAARVSAGIDVVFAGEGGRRQEWEARALRHVSDHLRIRFIGLIDPSDRDGWFDWADLLVVPSLWPEPFGLVGPEAAVRGVPAVAFDNGGTPQWLLDGRTGRLAERGRLDPEALGEAIAWCADAGRLTGLAEAARAHATGWSMERHVIDVENALTRTRGEHLA
jgi:glycosyltransferase involved in cell wall biosynthesis